VTSNDALKASASSNRKSLLRSGSAVVVGSPGWARTSDSLINRRGPVNSRPGIQYRPVFRLPSIRGRLLPRAPTPLEPITQDHLDDQAIRTRCQAEADSEVELPLGPEVEVDHGEELVLLIVRSVEVGHRA
jgi:hypothetical protein